jgi:hypothetical protein
MKTWLTIYNMTIYKIVSVVDHFGRKQKLQNIFMNISNAQYLKGPYRLGSDNRSQVDEQRETVRRNDMSYA